MEAYSLEFSNCARTAMIARLCSLIEIKKVAVLVKEESQKASVAWVGGLGWVWWSRLLG